MTREKMRSSKKDTSCPSVKNLTIAIVVLALLLLAGGLCISENLTIPVKGATKADWNAKILVQSMG